MTNPLPPARLFVLLASNSPVGVIFRRGPSDWVQMIKWHTDNDKFEEGQWFHGRIYEQLSDISPNGRYVTYHAFKPDNSIKNPSYGNRWTALSIPPRFTAVTLWPFHGDKQRGGAYFQSNDTLVLNHHEEDNQHFHFKHVPPKYLSVILPSEWEGTRRQQDMMGTLYLLVDMQLFERRLDRNGWKNENEEGHLQSRRHKQNRTPIMSYIWDYDTVKGVPEPNQTWFKTHKSSLVAISVSRTRHILRHVLRNLPAQFGVYRYRRIQNKLTYDYLLTNHDRTDLYPIDNITWADFDQQGRLVLAKEGKLFAGTLENGELQLTELADFNANKPKIY